MNILHIVSAKEWGGGETAALSMCRIQKKYGHEVFVAVERKNEKIVKRFYNSARTTLFHFSFLQFLISLVKLRCLIKKEKIQVIHTHSGKVLLLTILANWGLEAKIISFRHNAIANKKDFLHRFIYSHTDAFVCVSKVVYDEQIKNVLPKEKEKFYIVHNGVFVKNVIPRDSVIREDVRVGYAGRIEKNKGLEDLVKAMSLLKGNRVSLHVAGNDETSFAQYLKCQLSENYTNVSVKWYGYIKNIDEFYEVVDVMVVPSVVKEAFGLTICEAMYRGIPVITTNNGAQKEIIDDGIDGLLVAPRNPIALKDALQRVISDNNLAKAIGEKAKEKVIKNFTMDIWMHKMNDLYEKLIG